MIVGNQLLFAQLIIPNAYTAFSNQLPLHIQFIQSQKIKSISCQIIDKKDLQIAENKGLKMFFEFNSNGLLTKYYYTSIQKIIEKEYHSAPIYKRHRKISNGHRYTKNEYIYDTIITTYFYNEFNLLQLKRYNDGNYYESYYLDYFKDGQLEKERRYKETNVSEIKSVFKLGEQTLISEESYRYLPISKVQFKKTCLNNENRSFKEIIYNLNDSSQILSINEQYTASWIIENKNFDYNKKGQLIKATYNSNSNDNINLIETYEYDMNDCLLTEKHYKNNELIREISYITDASKKLNSYIIRDPNSKSLRIVKLIYEY